MPHSVDYDCVVHRDFGQDSESLGVIKAGSAITVLEKRRDSSQGIIWARFDTVCQSLWGFFFLGRTE